LKRSARVAAPLVAAAALGLLSVGSKERVVSRGAMLAGSPLASLALYQPAVGVTERGGFGSTSQIEGVGFVLVAGGTMYLLWRAGG